jgi:hypothetical protein
MSTNFCCGQLARPFLIRFKIYTGRVRVIAG